MTPTSFLNQVRSTLFPPLPLSGSPLSKALAFDEVLSIRDQAAAVAGHETFFDSALRLLNIGWHAKCEELAQIPATGPVVVVANHPHGLVDGLVLGSLLAPIRRDVKFLANSLLSGVAPPDSMIPVNPFEDEGQTTGNAAALRQSLRWLNGGGTLVVFPAGEVAALDLSSRSVREPDWKETAARLALFSGATTVPVRIDGFNGPVFHLAGLVHPSMRTALLPRELVNKRGRNIHVTIGVPVSHKRLSDCSGTSRPTSYLRWRVNALRPAEAGLRAKLQKIKPPVATQSAGELIAKEVERLPEGAQVLETSDWQVICTDADRIPQAILEIGRLREISFRAAGEGSGKSRDLDAYDRHYRHLLLWNKSDRRIGGAYRLAFTCDVAASQGARGLYTGSLFRFKREFFDALGPAMELGRSFVRLEYQKEFAPLLLLWRGIGGVLKRRPETRALFGAVSISAVYRPESRALIASFLRAHHWRSDLAAMVSPKSPWMLAPDTCVPQRDERDLSDALKELEPDLKTMPVLLRQYLNLGGRVLALSRDGRFSDVLDALVAVDIHGIPARSVSRYLNG